MNPVRLAGLLLATLALGACSASPPAEDVHELDKTYVTPPDDRVSCDCDGKRRVEPVYERAAPTGSRIKRRVHRGAPIKSSQPIDEIEGELVRSNKRVLYEHPAL